jgi:hypothetical protein
MYIVDKLEDTEMVIKKPLSPNRQRQLLIPWCICYYELHILFKKNWHHTVYKQGSTFSH